ncbi:hypothetical protein SO802_001724 [Lithocarpus litseifolius]|uniref:Uncharacterized protein n=1 Tax=Lithocarpus litseifolius TaxID=425828 RepID=A0AAW2DV73_9ROSI
MATVVLRQRERPSPKYGPSPIKTKHQKWNITVLALFEATAVALSGVKRAASTEPVNLGEKLVRTVEKFLEGVQGRRVGAMLRAACILMGFQEPWLFAQIFAGAFPENYVPPPCGFYYEVNDDSPIVQVKIIKTCYRCYQHFEYLLVLQSFISSFDEGRE